MKEFRKLVQDATLLGDWEELPKGVPLSTYTKNEDDTEILDGIIIKGYETKFGEGTNTNGERYTKDAIDNFIQSYFVDKQLNMPLDIEHSYDPQWLAGRIIYIESNSVGFYYVAYIPKTYMHYEEVKNLLANKVLQGFSKYGWCTKGRWVDDPNDEVYGGYLLVEEMMIVRMSLVSTPANGIPFEAAEEIANATRFSNKSKKNSKVRNGFAAMFNK